MSTDCTLKIYLENIRHYPLLSFEEEIALSKEIQAGNKEAELKMINSNLRLVIKISRRYVTPEVPIMDVIQEGNIGLMTAVKKYKAAFSVRFSTYACWWIRQSISRSLSTKKRIIKLPHRKEELLKRILRACNDLQTKKRRNPSIQELADYTFTTPQNISELIDYMTPAYSLDADIESSERNTFADVYMDSTYNPEATVMREFEIKEALHFLETVLQDRERDILIERLNLRCRLKPITLKALGNRYGISAETVRQIELRSLQKLQKFSPQLRSSIS